MVSVLEKRKNKEGTSNQKANNKNKIKKIVKTYLDLGLIDGYIDKDGKTILSKEAYDDWD